MAIRVGLGTSENSESFQAGQEAARTACQNAMEDFLDLVLVFASSRFDQQALIQGIKYICPDTAIIGCSSAGEITTGGCAKGSVAVMGIKSDSLRFATGLGCGLSQDARAAGQKCAQEVFKARVPNRQIFVMLSDGLSGNGSDVLWGIQEVLGTSFPIVGGSAGDDSLFQKTFQYHRDKVFSDSVVGILLGGDISVGVGLSHGWHAIGKARQVTKTQGNIIEELDGKQALTLYQDYFGDEAETLRRFPWAKIGTIYPLGLSIPKEEEYLIRYVSQATDQGGLVCAAEVPHGSQVRLMVADKSGVLEAAREAAEKVKDNLKDAEIRAVLIFDSVARKRILGREAMQEIEVIKNILGKNVPVIGFYSYGEQAPLRAERYIGRSYFHNEAIVVLAIAEPK